MTVSPSAATTMLHALVLQLTPPPGTPPPQTIRGDGVQALVLDLFRRADPALAEQLHIAHTTRPFTVAVLPSAGPQILLRVGLVGAADLLGGLAQALFALGTNHTLRLGTTPLALQAALGTPESHPWAGYTALADLVAAVRPSYAVTLEFATATAIAQRGRSDGKDRLALLPVPTIIFKSLARRWNELIGPEPLLDPAQIEQWADDVLVSDYQLRSTQIDLGKGPQKGFVGRCTYELPSAGQAARALTLLADAAFYLGVGGKTARGMGLCRRVQR